ncbi:MAG: hypothetical protein DYG89_15140 [Caldilinea sp. CFX5]|nr:hypothetical protein [Caldilinea sp. CFX5]
MAALRATFRKWKIKDWEVEPVNPPARRDRYHSYGDRKVVVRFKLYNKQIVLVQTAKQIAHDNLEDLAQALETIRMSKVRGIEDLLVAAYRQIDPVVITKSEPKPPKLDPTSPYVILGVEEHYPLAIIEIIWKARLRVEHPDAGGNADRAKALNGAMQEIRRRSE